MPGQKHSWIVVVLFCFLATYIASYIVFSRIAFVKCETMGISGFYFFYPEDTNAWRIKNYTCVYFYYPLIVMDEWLGTGKAPGCVPTWKLSRNENAQKTNDMPIGCLSNPQSLIP